MAVTDAPPSAPAPTTYSTPSDSDLAAVAATVAVVGVFMAVLITWLVLRLRRSPADIPVAAHRAAVFRPSFAPSEASSKLGFIRKPLRHEHTSWDFADPDPFSLPKDRHRPAPLSPAHRTSTHTLDFGPRTPTTPTSVEPPPPAYCRESSYS